jgi:hypothetical protein
LLVSAGQLDELGCVLPCPEQESLEAVGDPGFSQPGVGGEDDEEDSEDEILLQLEPELLLEPLDELLELVLLRLLELGGGGGPDGDDELDDEYHELELELDDDDAMSSPFLDVLKMIILPAAKSGAAASQRFHHPKNNVN